MDFTREHFFVMLEDNNGISLFYFMMIYLFFISVADGQDEHTKVDSVAGGSLFKVSTFWRVL